MPPFSFLDQFINCREQDARALYNLYMTGEVAPEQAPHLSVLQAALRNPETADYAKKTILDHLAATHIPDQSYSSTAHFSPYQILAMYAHKHKIDKASNFINLQAFVNLTSHQQQAHFAGLCLSKKPYNLYLAHHTSAPPLESIINLINSLSEKELSFKYLFLFHHEISVDPAFFQPLIESLRLLDFSQLQEVDLSDRTFDRPWIAFILNLVAILPPTNKLIFDLSNTNYFRLEPELRRTLIMGIGNHASMLRFEFHNNTQEFNPWSDFFTEIRDTSISGLAFNKSVISNTEFFLHLARSNINLLEITHINFTPNSFNVAAITHFFAHLKTTKIRSLYFTCSFNLNEMTEEQLNAFCTGLKETGIIELRLQGVSPETNQPTAAVKSRISTCIMHNMKNNEKRHGTLKGLIMHSLWEQQPKQLEQIQDSAMDDVKEDVKKAVASFKAAVTF